jgi:hypothetical protein
MDLINSALHLSCFRIARLERNSSAALRDSRKRTPTRTDQAKIQWRTFERGGAWKRAAHHPANKNRLAAAGERGGGKSAPRARGMEWPRAPAVVVSCREYRPGASRAGQRPRYAPLPHSSHPSRLRDRKFESIPLQQRESANFRFLTTSSNPVPPAKS